MEPKFQVQLKIRKPVGQVFDAVVSPEKLSGYFLQSSTGPLEAGKTVQWKFPEMDMSFDVIVGEVVKDERISLDWPSPVGVLIHVVMTFTPMDDQNTMVAISESGWPDTPQGSQASHGNAGGWMHMMCSLKGYLEYGINLRAGGAF